MKLDATDTGQILKCSISLKWSQARPFSQVTFVINFYIQLKVWSVTAGIGEHKTVCVCVCVFVKGWGEDVCVCVGG